jgi:adenosine deaminase
MSLESFIRAMPKVELHVHLEGSTRPETLLQLARKHDVPLPARDVEGLREWYRFSDFDHFLQVYLTISRCLRTPDDIELIAREFLAGQAAQNVLHTEATYTPYSQYLQHRIPWPEQLAAINRARAWAAGEYGISMTLTIDISRNVSPEEGLITADWAIDGMGQGVTGFGLGGPEVGHPPEKHRPGFDRAIAAGLPSLPHAGETAGPESVWGALKSLRADRIGHGVRAIEDPELIEELRVRQIPLEVSPTSNLCLKVAPSLAGHPLPKLIEAGLVVTLNSDDPPLFNTTLTGEWLAVAGAFGYGLDVIERLSFNALNAALLAGEEKARLTKRFEEDWEKVRRTEIVA